jgi:hypothetical protein
MATTHNRLLHLEDWQAKCFAKEVHQFQKRLSRAYGISDLVHSMQDPITIVFYVLKPGIVYIYTHAT